MYAGAGNFSIFAVFGGLSVCVCV
eukprot:COSAG02_NODE_45219_length_359_cov_0.773077_2_plen_23_part_01